MTKKKTKTKKQKTFVVPVWEESYTDYFVKANSQEEAVAVIQDIIDSGDENCEVDSNCTSCDCGIIDSAIKVIK